MKNSDKPEKPFTWWDDVKYGIGYPILFLSFPVLIILTIILALR